MNPNRSTTEDHRRVTADESGGTEALLAEFATFRQLTGPGVADADDPDFGDSGTSMVLRFTGRPFLDAVAELDTAAVGALLASVSDVVGRIHGELSSVGNLGADSLVVDSEQRPTIVDLGAAETHLNDADRSGFEADVEALGALLRVALSHSPSVGGLLERALLDVAADTEIGAQRNRTTEQFGREIRQLVGGPAVPRRQRQRLPRRLGASVRLPRFSRRRETAVPGPAEVSATAAATDRAPRGRLVLVGIAAVVVSGAVAISTSGLVSSGTARSDNATATETDTTVSSDPAPSDPAPSDPAPSVGSTPRTPATSDRVATSTSAAPDPDPTAVPRVEVDGVSYEIGEPGDVVAVGDWWCRGATNAAVLRPGSGAVYLFERWAEPGEGLLPPEPIPVGSDAITLTAEPITDCDRLVVGRADGSSQILVVPALGS